VTEEPASTRPADELMRAIAARTETARRLDAGAGAAVLRSIVEATVTLFQANAASIALYDPATDRLVFRVAAGEQGAGVIGLSIGTDQGLAGYVFSTGQAIAISDVKNDVRFGRAFAERTGYVPTSIVAVPLTDEQGTIGVLQVLDKKESDAFSLRDVELAAVFARQAAIAISASRIERDTGLLLAEVARQRSGRDLTDEERAAIVDAATAELAAGERSGLWGLADAVGRLRRADPEQVALVADLLAVLATHAERTGRPSRRGRLGAVGRARPTALASDDE
jgi:GAF domain-containing protein